MTKRIRNRSKYIVTTEEKVTFRGRIKPEVLERHYTVYAYSNIQARKSVHGKVTKVTKVT